MSRGDRRPVVWLPFDPADLGSLPDALSYERVLPGDLPLDRLPASAADVALYVTWDKRHEALVRIIPRLPRLEAVQVLSSGVDGAAEQIPDRIVLCNGRGIHRTAVAEMAVALILAVVRELPESARRQAEGEWVHGLRAPGLAGRRVMILGYGSVGEGVERRLAGFECDIVRVARTRRKGVCSSEQLDELLPATDVVVITVPLTAQTRGLVDAAFLGALPDGAVVVNISRGPVVVSDDLLAECASGRLFAALDVTDPEPLPPEHPLWRTRGVLVTPHAAAHTDVWMPHVLDLVRSQIERFAAGEPLANVVGPELSRE